MFEGNVSLHFNGNTSYLIVPCVPVANVICAWLFTCALFVCVFFFVFFLCACSRVPLDNLAILEAQALKVIM